MFSRKRREKPQPDHVYEEMVKASEEQKINSRRELSVAREIVDVLNDIRLENHIVNDLRKVFGGN